MAVHAFHDTVRFSKAALAMFRLALEAQQRLDSAIDNNDQDLLIRTNRQLKTNVKMKEQLTRYSKHLYVQLQGTVLNENYVYTKKHHDELSRLTETSIALCKEAYNLRLGVQRDFDHTIICYRHRLQNEYSRRNAEDRKRMANAHKAKKQQKKARAMKKVMKSKSGPWGK